ncbi:MAG: hypothetical protein ACK6DX_01640 [Acidobacteriota bacterium]
MREHLAMALYSATVGEPDPAARLALAERIESLHAAHGQEPAVREQLAKALLSATVGEPNPAACLALAERIESLHAAHGQEPAVRKFMVYALMIAAAQAEEAQQITILQRINTLAEQHRDVLEWVQHFSEL